MNNKKTKKVAKPEVTREDVKAKILEVNKAVDELKKDSMSGVKAAAIFGVVVLVGIAFLSGNRKAARPKTLLKIIKTK
mgnify:CR=1 FL=1